MTDEFNAFNPFDEVENEPAEEQEVSSEVSFEEEKRHKTEKLDEEKLEEIEDEYKELDEDLLDVEDGEDTMWMIQRVSIGILKLLGIIGVIGLIFWAIWGGGDNKNTKNPVPKSNIEKNTEEAAVKKETKIKEDFADKNQEKTVEKNKEEDFWGNLFGGAKDGEIDNSRDLRNSDVDNQKEDIPAVSSEELDALKTEIKTSSPHLATIQIMAWNYWVEKERLLGQKNTLGDVALWTKDVESLFDVPFIEQVKGENDIQREKKVNTLINNTTDLLKKAEVIQNKLLAEISEHSVKEKQFTAESIAYEEKFLSAMSNSDPTGIDEFLSEKIEAEKKQIENGIEAESRLILSNKVDSYAQIILNLRDYLIANKNAIIKDVQVVEFKEDPFNRIIPFNDWQNTQS